MVGLSASAAAGEALVLGLTTGPVCVASCGPVVVPWILLQPQSIRAHLHQLLIFLAGRLAGYLLFACGVWMIGASLSHFWEMNSWITGIVQILLAAALVAYVFGWPRRIYAASHQPKLVQIGAEEPKCRGPIALGFLSGINLCPPFLVAGLRAAQLGSLAGSLVFFLFFFAGTAVWFAPFLAFGAMRRTPAVITVARMVAVLLACWYTVWGISILIGRAFHG